LVPAALEKLEKGGTLALAGIHMTPIPQMDYERCVFYERDIRSVTCNTRDDGRRLLADANRALQELKSDQIQGTGVLVME